MFDLVVSGMYQFNIYNGTKLLSTQPWYTVGELVTVLCIFFIISFHFINMYNYVLFEINDCSMFGLYFNTYCIYFDIKDVKCRFRRISKEEYFVFKVQIIVQVIHVLYSIDLHA